jgi:hypothetical protein
LRSWQRQGMGNSGSRGKKRLQQARHEADLRQTVGMNVQILISNLCGATGVAQACGNQVFLQPR